MGLPKIEAKFETSLSSKITAADTSMVLVTHVDKNGAELEGEYGFLIDGDNSSAEYVVGTVSNGTVTITKRGLDFGDGTTERAGLKKVHVRGASVKITDHPVLALMRGYFLGETELPEIISYDDDKEFTNDQEIVAKKYVDDLIATCVKDTGDETIAGEKTFSTFPITPSAAPDSDYEVANKKYCDDNFVPNTGNTTIAGEKTFSSFPITPSAAPDADYEVANKKYIDDIAIAGGVNASTSAKGITKLNAAPADAENPIALGANEAAETGASKILRLKSDGKIDTSVIPDASTTVAGKVKLNVAPASATEPIAVGVNDTAETGASKVVRLKSTGKLNTTVMPVLTKGNVMVAGGANYDTALAVGTDGQVLVADAASALGVKWETPSDPLTNIKDYLTHIYVARPTIGHTTESATDQIYVAIASDQVSNYSDLVLMKFNKDNQHTISLKYLSRESTFKKPYSLDENWVSVTYGDGNTIPAGVIIGNYFYVFYTYSATLTCSRYDKTTLANAASITIGAGGNTNAKQAATAVLTDGTYIYIKTTTADSWNKYSISGTTLSYVEGITMENNNIYGSAWNYNSADSSWIGLNPNDGAGGLFDFTKITIGSATSTKNTSIHHSGREYLGYDLFFGSSAGRSTSYPSLLRRTSTIYEIANAETLQGYVTEHEGFQTLITFEPVNIPTLS